MSRAPIKIRSKPQWLGGMGKIFPQGLSRKAAKRGNMCLRDIGNCGEIEPRNGQTDKRRPIPKVKKKKKKERTKGTNI